MRLLRPDLLQWWLVIPVLVASCGLHWRLTRRFRRREAIDRRFASLSRRSTWRRHAAICGASVLAAAAIVFALMRPQLLMAERVPDYEHQDLIVMLDRSISMRARDIAPSRFARATAELRNLLRQKPEGIDRIGLVGFADSSLVLSYLTGDVESILFYLEWLDAEPSVLFGTNLGAAL
ncbi:MAG TPA: VWA domain-containing protein, partial [Candidatus Elarobacter sp.]|nr:VWA domain-containing protein [Candidatus Elarobacter sp.]